MPRALGRITPPDWEHVNKYPLKALGAAVPTGVPVTIGINWYEAFDNPVKIGTSWHLADTKKEDLGNIRGGHCVSLQPLGAVVHLTKKQWIFYNQLTEGACEGFGHSRSQTTLRGGLYDALWLYDAARAYEHNTGEGTCNRSVCAVLKSKGLRTQAGQEVCQRDPATDGPVEKTLGISAYRWATTAEEVCNALGRPNASSVPLVNSWGKDYPMVVWLPVSTLERVLQEEGEADVVTDR